MESTTTTAAFDIAIGFIVGFLAGFDCAMACGDAEAAIAHPATKNAEANTFTSTLEANLRWRNISSLIVVLAFSAGHSDVEPVLT
ncbi:MAG: hypothetical protein WBF06_12465 [Candidatus Acidiferrales bacterium]